MPRPSIPDRYEARENEDGRYVVCDEAPRMRVSVHAENSQLIAQHVLDTDNYPLVNGDPAIGKGDRLDLLQIQAADGRRYAFGALSGTGRFDAADHRQDVFGHCSP